MINLSVQDSIDGNGKINELRSMIGETFSDNTSSTLNSKLLKVSGCGNICMVIEVESEYNKKVPSNKLKTQPSWLVWNAMCSQKNIKL